MIVIYTMTSWIFALISQDLQISMMLRQRWRDERLYFANLSDIPSLTIDSDETEDAVWVPDVFFVNEKESRLHLVPQPNRYVRIFSNGTVLYSIRYVKLKPSNLYLRDIDDVLLVYSVVT